MFSVVAWVLIVSLAQRRLTGKGHYAPVFSFSPSVWLTDGIIDHMLEEIVRQVLKKECHLDTGQPILVGVSGGPDSVCLLDLLRRAGYPILVAHFNHHLRPQADSDAGYVASVASTLGLPLISGGEDIRQYASQERLSLEEAARIRRYQFLFTQGRLNHTQAVAVGHTADDQVETVLMHLLRGAGLSGLKGMTYCSRLPEWDASIPLIRPLLGIWREEIIRYCSEHQLQPVFDQSNQDTTYFRNRLRHELISTLESYNPRVKETIWRMARSLSGDEEVLNRVYRRAFESCRVEQGDTYIGFDRARLCGYSEGERRGVFRLAIAALRPVLRDIDFGAIERSMNYLENPPETGQADLIEGLWLVFDPDVVYIAEVPANLPRQAWPQVGENCPELLTLEKPLNLEAGWRMTAAMVAVTDHQPWQQENPFEAWLDPKVVYLPLVVRKRAPGDRFRPLGMETGSIKISDFFVNEKIPRRARDRWPLVCSEGDIAWVPGHRLAHPYRLREGAKKAVHLKVSRE